MQPQYHSIIHNPNPQPQPLNHPQKRQIFRQQIRRRQIEQIKKQIRLKYYHFKQPSDYQLLRNIDLTKLISDCKRSGIFENKQNIHALFLYASSKSADHLFQLLDEGFVEMLVNGLVGGFQEVCWHRQILWILTNYTSYSYIVSDLYLNKLILIAKYIFSPTQHPHQFLQQTEQNIVLSIGNLIEKSNNCRYIMKQHNQLFYCIIFRFLDRKPTLSQKITQEGHIPKLAEYYGQFLHNLYACIQYFQIQEDQQFNMVKEIVNIVMSALGYGFMKEDDKNTILMFINAITRLFQNSFDKNPELILTHKKQIKKLGTWFEKFIKTQKQSSKSDQIIVAYMSFLQIVYGPNIPEKYEDKISKFYVKYFQQHVGKVCTSLFMSKKNFLHMSTLRLLQPILMEQSLAERIATEYLPIISHIFEHITRSSFGLKKQALICLVNLLKSTLYQQSQSYNEVLELLLANKVADILAYNIWCFVDQDLNYELLQGVDILLQAEKNQYGAKLRFWQQFKEAGGVIKMENILEESESAILKQEVNRILNSVRQVQQETIL